MPEISKDKSPLSNIFLSASCKATVLGEIIIKHGKASFLRHGEQAASTNKEGSE